MQASECLKFWVSFGIVCEEMTIIVNGKKSTHNALSAKTYLASGTPLLRQDTRYSNFAPLTLGSPRAGLPPSLAPGESGGPPAI